MIGVACNDQDAFLEVLTIKKPPKLCSGGLFNLAVSITRSLRFCKQQGRTTPAHVHALHERINGTLAHELLVVVSALFAAS